MLQSICPSPTSSLQPELYLPDPLYFLYSHLIAYIEVGDGEKRMSLSIEGKQVRCQTLTIRKFR